MTVLLFESNLKYDFSQFNIIIFNISCFLIVSFGYGKIISGEKL